MNTSDGLGDIDFIARTATPGTDTRTTRPTNGLYDTSEDGNLTAIAGFTATDTRVVLPDPMYMRHRYQQLVSACNQPIWTHSGRSPCGFGFLLSLHLDR